MKNRFLQGTCEPVQRKDSISQVQASLAGAFCLMNRAKMIQQVIGRACQRCSVSLLEANIIPRDVIGSA